MNKLKLCRLTLCLALLSVTAGCGTISDVCNVAYLKVSKRDTDATQAQALAQNQFLAAQGCPTRFSPIVGGSDPAPRPAGLVNPFKALVPE